MVLIQVQFAVPSNEQFVLTLNLTDPVTGGPLSGANVRLVFNGQNATYYYFTGSPIGSGIII